MNHFAYRTTGLAIKTIAGLTRARLNIHGMENIPGGPTIFVVNHFTRIETFLLPYHLHRLTGTPVWALAAAELFVGKFGRYLEQLGAVSTRMPDRDRLMVKTLLTAEACWIVFPEGRMVKNKKIMEKGRFMISYAGGKHPPHTGAATLALRTEFYRQRIAELARSNPKEAQRLADLFKLPAVDSISQRPTCIVPVNLTYYPLRAKDNALSRLAGYMVEDLPDRLTEEIITEGAMLLSGVDIDMRFGEPIEINSCLSCQTIQCDIRSASPIGFDDLIPSRKFMRREALKIMQRYMAAIYRLTTVNHDHLFASCLKKSPVKRIKKDNLKRRVYLASQRDAGSGSVHYHSSFEKDQVHLLTDDRYNKFSEFVDFAEEKKVVAVNGSVLEKDTTLLSAVFDFHRSRIDNPIAVIANEVEPLTRLQRRISRLCWQPGFWLKRRVVRMLMKRALDDFNRDYDAFFSSGTSKARDVCRPFLIKGGPPPGRSGPGAWLHGRPGRSQRPCGVLRENGILGIRPPPERARHRAGRPGRLHVSGLDRVHGCRVRDHQQPVPSGDRRRIFHRCRPGTGPGPAGARSGGCVCRFHTAAPAGYGRPLRTRRGYVEPFHGAVQPGRGPKNICRQPS
jgi:1-acyl-sn-glycerol-3-phosphate acyltransferase